MVNSSVYEKVTYKQIDDMKHAIGFDNQKCVEQSTGNMSHIETILTQAQEIQRIGNSLCQSD